MKPRRVVITIDEIVLDAVGSPGRAATAAALERELVRIFTTQPESAGRGGHIGQLSAPAMTIAPNAAPDALAAGLAERIHRGVIGAGQTRAVAAGPPATTAHAPRRRS
ncbi:MAG TPA: hypothetical protein VGC09_11015 [Rhodopila sp.]